MSIVFANTTLAAPIWRTDPPGQATTTYQEWTFDTDPIGWQMGDPPPVLNPEVDLNTYGDPTATLVLIGDLFPGWLELGLDRQGVWFSDDMGITLDIPNSDIVNEYKEIWIELGYKGDFDGASINTENGETITDLGHTIVPDGGQWNILTIGWLIEPNPTSETIHFDLSDSGVYLNYIIVDTICIPEPTTLLLLGLGCLGLIRKRGA